MASKHQMEARVLHNNHNCVSVQPLLHCVIVKAVESVGLTGMHETGCSGETRLVLHVPSSS